VETNKPLASKFSKLAPCNPASKTTTRQSAPSKLSKIPEGKAKAVQVKPSLKTQKSHVPSAPQTKALQFKMPKKSRNNSAEAIQRRLKKQSPWYASIVDPLHGADCKIPDETGVETGVLQIVQRGEVTSNASGIAGARVISPYINLQGGATGVNIQILNTSSTGTTIAWGNGTLNGNSRGFEFNGSSEIRTITNAHRIVSAGMYIQPEPSLATNSGEVVLWSTPFAAEDSPLYTDYMNRYKSVVLPINSNDASKVLWYPFMREDWSFKSFIKADGTTFNDEDESNNSVPYWNFGFVASGMPTDTPVVIRYTVVVNLEFVPKFNTLNVLGASPSPQDVTETDLVENWVQDMPVATAISQKAAASSPSTVSPKHDDDATGFGMFFNVVKELAPIAMAML